MKKKSSAFSLIELSIVILIIGVLIAGVTQASRLVRQSKLTTARTLTQSSPVNSISGLLLWVDSTMESSFKSTEASDGTQITTWYDINPQLQIPNTYTASSSEITYKASSVTNSLPTVAFADDNTAFSTTSYIEAPFNSYTIFAVARSTDLTAENTIFYNGLDETNGFGLSLTTAGYTKLTYGAASSVTGTSASAASQGASDIICITIAPNSVDGAIVSTPAALSYKNGVADISSTITATNWVSPTTGFFIGNATASSTTKDFIGEISEIIIFSGVLKKSDRQEVEKYLSKKYGINIIQN